MSSHIYMLLSGDNLTQNLTHNLTQTIEVANTLNDSILKIIKHIQELYLVYSSPVRTAETLVNT